MFFRSTTTYNVFVKAGEKNNLESAVFVREGFSFLAFIFSIIWALFQRLWVLVGVVAAGIIIISFLKGFGYINAVTFELFQIGISVWLAFDLAEWKCDDLKRKGYVLYDVIIAQDEPSAQIRFYDRHLGT